MLASDIFEEAKEVLSNNDPAFVFRAMTRAVELLAPTGLFDPLVADLDFSVSGTYLVPLPRDVKSVLRININNNPSFARSRLFEYAQNTDGTVTGPEVGWSWADRGTTPIQDPSPLPGKLLAIPTSAADNDKTMTVTGRDAEGRTIKEVLTLHLTDAPEGELTFAHIDSVVRDATSFDVLLCVGAEPLAKYYPDEREPRYRLIKLSRTDVSCRMHYRRTTYKILSLDDIVPVDSPMGMLMMLDAVNLFWKKEYAAATLAQAAALKFVTEEQASRADGVNMSASSEGQTATNRNIGTLDEIIVADVYDEACSIFGPLGRDKIFDRITDAVEALSRKGHWDSLVGQVDIWKPANPIANGHGYFALPRFVETPLSINLNGDPGIARNGWFEFHLNGPGESNKSSCGTWDDVGNSPVITGFPVDGDGKVIPHYLMAVPDDPADDDTTIRVFGEDLNGMPIFVDGAEGILVPCKSVGGAPNPDAPAIARITRVEKGKSSGFITLRAVPTLVGPWAYSTVLGYYYPDETAPVYRVIKLPSAEAKRIRVKYRKRRSKIASLFEPLHLRSRLAVEAMMRAIQIEKTDVNAAALHELNALKYLKDEQAIGKTPTGFTMQFDSASMPGVTSYDAFE